MKFFLQDLIAHTHTLGLLPILKVISSDESTVVESLSAEREVKLDAFTHSPIREFNGTFGLTNLNKLDFLLKCPEYKENAQLTVQHREIDGEPSPIGLHFQNAFGDFQNDYRFINKHIISEKIKKPLSLMTIDYNFSFAPSKASIQRLKHQAAVHTEETLFNTDIVDNNLVFSFGNDSTHAGSFIFHSDVNYKFKNNWEWPIAPILDILSLDGDITMSISDSAGAMQITVVSGIATYNYLLFAFVK